MKFAEDSAGVGSRNEVVQAVTERPEPWLVEAAIDSDVGSDRVLDSRRGLGQRHDRTALQQPDQARRVIAAQTTVAWVRPVWRLVQAEQVRRAPIQCLGLLAPLGEESLAVVDTLLPARDRDMGQGLELEVGEGPPIPQPRRRQLDDFHPAASTVRLGRD
jgi:hypothetical protein